MATSSLTEEGKQKTFQQLVCSADLSAGLHGQLTFISVLNIFLSVTAFVGNALILAALRKESSLHPHSKLLLRNLATTDLCVGLISQPLYATSLMSVANENWHVCRYVVVANFITSSILGGVSVLTLTAISMDRLLALLLGLRYRQVVTLKRTYVIVITFWVVSTVFSTKYLWDRLISVWSTILGVSLCLVISFFSYTTIFLKLLHRQSHVEDQARQPNQLNIARHRKAVASALWLQLALVACYLPFGIVAALRTDRELSKTVFLAYQYTVTLVFFNSSLNPILYCFKINEVRKAVKGMIRQVLCCSSS